MPLTFLDAVDFTKVPALQFVIPVVSADPTGYEAGLIYNSTTKEIKYHNGTSWVALGPAGAGGPPTGAASGDLTGSYPGPTIGNTKVIAAYINAALVASGETGTGVTGTAATTFPALRAIGTGANQVVAGNDSRLTDARNPTGTAGGELAGTYPNPNIALTRVASGETTGAGTGTAAANVAALRAIGAGANQVVAGNDARLTDARTPSGTIGGDLTGSTWPTLNIGTGKVTTTHILDGTITDTDVNALNKDGASGTASMRTLAFTGNAAMPGTARLDQIAAPTASVALNNQKITGLGAPSAATDAATMGYVDSVAQGLDAKASVAVATTTNIASLAGGAPKVLESVTLSVNDRVLVKDQTTTNQNGIYVVTTVGTGSNGTWTRATDMDSWTEVPGAYVWVEMGTTNADTGWVCTADQGGTIGVTAITWTQFSSAGSAIAGAGLTKTGNVIDVVANADNTITVNANDIQVNSTNVEITSRKDANSGYAGLDSGGKVLIGKIPTGTTGTTVALGNHNHDAAYVSLTQIAAKGDIIAGTANDTTGVLTAGANGLVLTADSTQATGLKWAAASTGVLKYVGNVGTGAATSIAVSHNLGTRDLTVAVYSNSDYKVVQCGVTMTDTNTVTLTFAVAPAANAYRVVIVG